MRQPTKALEISQHHCFSVETSMKTISIRNGHRDFKPGDKIIIYADEPDFVVKAIITKVLHVTYGKITPKDYQDDGFNSIADMILGMKDYYPDITEDGPATVIRWRLGWD